jgi:hypothetical protein
MENFKMEKKRFFELQAKTDLPADELASLLREAAKSLENSQKEKGLLTCFINEYGTPSLKFMSTKKAKEIAAASWDENGFIPESNYHSSAGFRPFLHTHQILAAKCLNVTVRAHYNKGSGDYREIVLHSAK